MEKSKKRNSYRNPYRANQRINKKLTGSVTQICLILYLNADYQLVISYYSVLLKFY